MTDLLTADGREVWDYAMARYRPGAWDHWGTLRDEIVRQCRAKWEAELADAEREVAWQAASDAFFAGWSASRAEERVGETLDEARDRYLRRVHPPATPRSVTLSDGRVVEWMAWDSRRGVNGPHYTLDLITNYGRQGCESRQCFASLDDMRIKVALTYADWQAIDKAFAATVEGR